MTALVYVLQEGAYDSRHIVAVFTTLKAAKEAALDNTAAWKRLEREGADWWNQSLDYEKIAWVTAVPFGVRPT